MFQLRTSRGAAVAWRQAGEALTTATLKPARRFVVKVRSTGARTIQAFSSASTNTDIAPSAVALAIAGYSPAIAQTANQALTPAVAAMVLAGYAPTIAQSGVQTVAPGVAALTLAGFAPTVAQSASQALMLGASSIALVGYAPAVVQVAGLSIQPLAASLVLTGFAPTLAQTGAQGASPSAAVLGLSGYAPSVVQSAPITTPTITPNEDDLFAALRAFLLLVLPSGVEVIQTQDNGVPMPNGPFVSMNQIGAKLLSTPVASYDGTLGRKTIVSGTEYSIQLDFYGPDSGDWAVMVEMLFRDSFSSENFPDHIVPLFTDAPNQIPMITGEQRWLQRWRLLAALQYNPVVTVGQQSATVIKTGVHEVDTTFPP